ncbi:MAG: hypothetical protein H7289_15935 [Mucilaginibacter sp.]|nr:hypothetical protein [Mucilaginibacter sp.]
MIKPKPNESVIKCDGKLIAGNMVWNDNCERINWLTSEYFTKISNDPIEWTTLYQDPSDLRYWELSYPHAEMHGGGPPQLECVTAVTTAYKKVKNAVNLKLKAKGYDFFEERYDEKAFGSRYVMWSNHQHIYRFVWDGKERWFVLEYAESLPVSLSTHWVELAVQQCTLTTDPEYIDEIIREFVRSLDNFRS